MEHVFNGLPSKQDYVRGVKSFIIENSIAFEEETDGESPTIGFLYDNEDMYQLSYETDELAPYLAIGKLMALPSEVLEKEYLSQVDIANKINNELIVMKMEVVKDLGLYFYVAMPFPFLNDLGSFIAYSINTIETGISHYNRIYEKNIGTDMEYTKCKNIRKEIIEILLNSLESLFTIDKRNIDMDVSEMNLCSRLAHYMEDLMKEKPKIFSGYYADTEYNRNYNGTIKKVDYSNDGHKSVRCDLLIHSRGIKDPDNLLALEMKKKGNDRNVIDDYDRLENITKPRKDSTPKDCVCGTLMGAFLEISSNMYKIDLTWYENDVVRHESRSKSF